MACKDCAVWHEMNARRLTEEERDRGILIGLLQSVRDHLSRIYVPFFYTLVQSTGGTPVVMVDKNNLQRQAFKGLYVSSVGGAAVICTFTLSGGDTGPNGQTVAIVNVPAGGVVALPDFDLPAACQLTITTNIGTSNSSLFVYGQTYVLANSVKEAWHGRSL